MINKILKFKLLISFSLSNDITYTVKPWATNCQTPDINNKYCKCKRTKENSEFVRTRKSLRVGTNLDFEREIEIADIKANKYSYVL